VSDTDWQDVATYASGFEADFAIAQLEAAGIPAMRVNNDIGFFGVGFQGPTTRGVTVRVPPDALEDAVEVLRPPGRKP